MFSLNQDTMPSTSTSPESRWPNSFTLNGGLISPAISSTSPTLVPILLCSHPSQPPSPVHFSSSLCYLPLAPLCWLACTSVLKASSWLERRVTRMRWLIPLMPTQAVPLAVLRASTRSVMSLRSERATTLSLNWFVWNHFCFCLLFIQFMYR